MALTSDNIRTVFAKTVRSIRARKGISQETLASAADLDRGYMSGLERGKHTPSLDTMLRLSKALGITFPEFAAELETRSRGRAAGGAR